MNKLHNYMLIMSGIILLFYLTGIITTGSLVELLLSPEDIESHPYFTTYLIPALSLAFLIGGIIIGIVSRDFRLLMRVSIGTWLFFVGTQFIAVYTVIASHNTPLALILLSPVTIMFYMVAMDWVTS